LSSFSLLTDRYGGAILYLTKKETNAQQAINMNQNQINIPLEKEFGILH
jgi:hypothetical protein